MPELQDCRISSKQICYFCPKIPFSAKCRGAAVYRRTYDPLAPAGACLCFSVEVFLDVPISVHKVASFCYFLSDPARLSSSSVGSSYLEEPLPVQRDQAEHDGLGVRSRVRVDAADPLGQTPFLSIGHACLASAIAAPASCGTTRSSACLLSSRAVPSEPSW